MIYPAFLLVVYGDDGVWLGIIYTLAAVACPDVCFGCCKGYWGGASYIVFIQKI